MRTARVAGFTLIELLTVIAIIAILAGLTAAALPRAIERARIADVQSDFKNIQTALATYYTEHGSYPAGYGFRAWETRGSGGPFNYTHNPSGPNDFFFMPYMAKIGLWGGERPDTNLHDRFSDNYDSDRDNIVGLFEFAPVSTGYFDNVPDPTPVTLYDGTVSQLDERMSTEQRPYVYAPVNLTIFKSVKQIWDQNDPLARQWITAWSGSVIFPEPNLDAYVLISMGPMGTTAGLVDPVNDDFLNSVPQQDWYHALSYRTFYLATRDLNNDGLPDYDFNTRKGGAGAGGFSAIGGLTAEQVARPPQQDAPGVPMIFIQKG